MPTAEPNPILSPDEYLAWEASNELRHEFFDGETYAHAGASDAHVTVAGNLFALLRSHVRGGPCRVYMADMKVRVGDEALFYPDVFVSCDERDRQDPLVKRRPLVVVEVLSDSTAAFDRGRKFETYRKLESLREYVLVDPERASIEVFRLGPDGHWVLYPYGPAGELELTSLGFRCPVDAVYEDVELTAEERKGA